MADDITICSVLNKDDNSSMTLFIEWLNSRFKITIFSTGGTALAGKMEDAEINKTAKNLSQTRDEYLHSVRCFLSGKDNDIQFYLKNSELSWKKGSWCRGIVDVKPVALSTVFPDVLKHCLLRDKNLNSEIQTLKHENEELKAKQKLLEGKFESIVNLKNSIENELYKKFIIVLNSKKEKIRELEAELQKKTPSSLYHDKSERFHASTDNSEISEDEEVDRSWGKCDKIRLEIEKPGFMSGVKRDKLLKRQIMDDEETMFDSEFEEDNEPKRNCKYKDVKLIREISIVESKESLVNRPSTSKIVNNLLSDVTEVCEEKRKNNRADCKIADTESQPIFSNDDESEEELFS